MSGVDKWDKRPGLYEPIAIQEANWFRIWPIDALVGVTNSAFKGIFEWFAAVDVQNSARFHGANSGLQTFLHSLIYIFSFWSFTM